MRLCLAALITIASLIAPVPAQARQVVDSREMFMGLVAGKELARFGITLEVMGDGQIQGEAFGTPVTGAWTWRNGFFCRDLYYGDRDLGSNCQQVTIEGERIRFQSDQGTGDHADFRIR